MGTMGLEDGTAATEESIGFGEGVVLLAAGILLLLSILTARDIDVLATNQKEGRRHTVTSEELLAFHSPQLTQSAYRGVEGLKNGRNGKRFFVFL